MVSDYVQVLTTAASEQDARALAGGLVEARLAGCAQVMGPVTSVYRWEGRIEEAQEWLCVVKTRRALHDRVEAFIRERHTYQVPEIIAVPISAGSPQYLAWLEQATGD